MGHRVPRQGRPTVPKQILCETPGMPCTSRKTEGRIENSRSAPGSEEVAGCSSTLLRALHANQLVIAQSDRTAVAEITRKRIRRGAFRSVRDLVRAINEYVRHYNQTPRPFQW